MQTRINKLTALTNYNVGLAARKQKVCQINYLNNIFK